MECDSPIFLRRRVIPSSGQWSEVARTYQSAVLREHPWLQFFWPSQVPYPCTSWVVQDKGKRRADETSVERLTGDGGRTLRATLRKIKTPSMLGAQAEWDGGECERMMIHGLRGRGRLKYQEVGMKY